MSTIKVSILIMGFLSSVLIDYTIFKVRYIEFEIFAVAIFQAFVNENGSYYFLSFFDMSQTILVKDPDIYNSYLKRRLTFAFRKFVRIMGLPTIAMVFCVASNIQSIFIPVKAMSIVFTTSLLINIMLIILIYPSALSILDKNKNASV